LAVELVKWVNPISSRRSHGGRAGFGVAAVRFAATVALCLCVAFPALAQDVGKAPLVGVLLINAAANPEPVVPLFRKALAALGYVEGRNLHLDFRFAEGHAERFPALAQALVRDKADVIVTLGDAATRAAQQATKTIPIVAIADDLVAAELIQSMVKPGGNTTGVSILATELDAKKLEVLSQQSRNQTGGEGKRLPRPCGQFWMIRRFTSAQIVPANAGAKAKNPVSSTLFSTPMVALLRHADHKILRTCCHESVRKRLRFFADRAAKKWPLRGSLKLGVGCL